MIHLAAPGQPLGKKELQPTSSIPYTAFDSKQSFAAASFHKPP